ncbi:GCN5 family acetyltransferase [Enterococcus sp. JM4C]|nr:GCN5 family acetyltransferase [Enterococcus sp. JM4C]
MTKQAINTQEEVAELYETIKVIWPEVFTPIIGAEQVAYMLRTYQSPENIAAEIESGARYFLLKVQGQPVGYTAYEVRDEDIYLSKIYLSQTVRGKGYSSEVFDWYEEVAREHGKHYVRLRVNQGNTRAIEVYEHRGFINKGVLISPIGEGFEMTDFVFEKEV